MAPVDSTQVLRGVNPSALERFLRVTEKPLVSGTPEVLNICAGDGIGIHQYFDTCGIAVRIDGDHLRGLLDLTDSVVVRRPLKSPFLQRHQRRHGQRGGHLRSLGTEARVSFKWLKGKQGGDDGADLSAVGAGAAAEASSGPAGGWGASMEEEPGAEEEDVVDEAVARQREEAARRRAEEEAAAQVGTESPVELRREPSRA